MGQQALALRVLDDLLPLARAGARNVESTSSIARRASSLVIVPSSCAAMRDAAACTSNCVSLVDITGSPAAAESPSSMGGSESSAWTCSTFFLLARGMPTPLYRAIAPVRYALQLSARRGGWTGGTVHWRVHVRSAWRALLPRTQPTVGAGRTGGCCQREGGCPSGARNAEFEKLGFQRTITPLN